MAPRKDTTLPVGTPRQAVLNEMGRRLNQLMVSKGWNQSDVARHATKFMPRGKVLSRDSISNYCNGKVWPTGIQLKAVADAFGVTPEEILPASKLYDTAQPAIEMKMLPDGTSWVSLNERLPTPVALQIAQLIQGTKKE